MYEITNIPVKIGFIKQVLYKIQATALVSRVYFKYTI